MISFIHMAPVHHVYVLDVPEYGSITITIRKGKDLVSARVDVPTQESPKDRKQKKQVTEWMNETLLPYQNDDGTPFLVTMHDKENQFASYLNPNQPQE